jgi:hypothetical protein
MAFGSEFSYLGLDNGDTPPIGVEVELILRREIEKYDELKEKSI